MTLKHLRRHVTLLPALFVAVAACGDDADPPTGPDDDGPTATASISVVDNSFNPGANAVDVGQTVTWTWAGSAPHNVTFDDSSVGNSSTQTDGSFQRTFDAAGAFTYYCAVHGRAVMSGSVVVGDGGVAMGTGAGYP